MTRFGQVLGAWVCMLALAAGAEDKWVFAIRYFQCDRDVALYNCMASGVFGAYGENLFY